MIRRLLCWLGYHDLECRFYSGDDKTYPDNFIFETRCKHCDYCEIDDE